MKPLAYLFGFFIAGIVILADLGMLGVLKLLNRIPCGDKIGHFILYGILTLLIDLALLRSPRGPNRPSSPHNINLLVLRVALILALFIGLEELSQTFFPSRSFDLIDLAFSYLGVTFFSWVALRITSSGAAR